MSILLPPLRNVLFAGDAWSPLRLGSSLWAWWRADAGLYQDTAPAVLATANNDAAAYWKDLSGNGLHLYQSGASSKYPTLKTGQINGLPALLFDGSNDCLLSVATISLSLYQIWFVAKRVGTTGILYEHSANVNAFDGSSWFLDGNNTTFQVVKRSSTISSYKTALGVYAIDSSNFGLYSHWFGGTGQHTDHQRYKNDVLNNFTADVLTATSGNPGTGSVTDTLYIGQRGNASSAASFYLAEMMITSAVLSSSLKSRIGRYFAERYALTIVT